MSQFATIDLDQAMERLRRRDRGSDARAPFREAIADLTADHMLELEPDAGESLRGLKVSVTLAAKEVNRAVRYGESEDGTLLVWLEAKPKRRRRRRRAATTG